MNYNSQYNKSPHEPFLTPPKDRSMNEAWDQIRKAKALPPQTVTLESLFPKIDRWAIGFDPIFDTLSQMSSAKTLTYPPYNLTKLKDGKFQIEIALAGFRRDDIEISVDGRTMTVSSDVTEPEETFGEVLHHGIAQRDFKQTFALAEYVEVEEAKMEDGILSIHLVTNIPEEKKPKVIEIN